MDVVEGKARKALEAREHLQTVMMQCASALSQTAEVLANISIELARASQAEQIATQSYIVELEMRLNGQRALS